MNLDSNDIVIIDHIVKSISWKITGLNYKKSKAMSLTDFYECAKEIRNEKNNLVKALLKYKELEIKNDLPIKLEYRSILKKLLK